MKLKNVSFIEQHFEKLFVGIAAVVLVLVAWTFLMGDPHAVNIDGQTKAPDVVDEYIASKAKNLQEAANSDEDPDWARQQMVRYREEFQARTVAPVLEVAKFEVPATLAAYFGEGGVTRPDEKPFIEPQYPAPTMFAWAARIGSISPEEMEVNPELEELFPAWARKADAYDTTYISLVGKWETAKVLEELTRKDEEAQLRPVPEQRVKSFAVMDVEVERQEARGDGTFAEPDDADYKEFEPVALPIEPPFVLRDPASPSGVSAFNPRVVPAVMDPAELGESANEDAMAYAALIQGDNQWLIVQPPFPQMLTEEWEEPMSPEAILQQKADRTEKEEIEEQFKEWQEHIDRLNAKIQKAQNRAQLRPAAAAAPGGDPLNARRPPRATAAANPGAGNRQVERYQQQISRIVDNKQVAELQERYQEITKGQTISLQSAGGLGVGGSYDAGMFGPGMGPGGPGGFGPSAPGASRRGAAVPQRPAFPQPGGFPAPGGFDGGFGGFPGGAPAARGMQMLQAAGIQSGVLTHRELTIYSHDLTVEPGKTYRYRLRLRIVNPLYNIANMPPGEQKDKHQNLFLIETDWTDWTAPIEAPQLNHYFVQNISPSPAPGRANIEVWRYYKGLWRTEEFTAVRPGHPVGQVKELQVFDPVLQRNRNEEVDFFAGDYLLHIVESKGPKGIGRSKTEPKARFLVNEREIVERAPSSDKQNGLRERLLQDKQRMEEIAGFGGGPVARFP